MKKLMLLGGSAQQIVAIEKAKKLGYYTILCDYLPDNPGQFYSDVFYQVSTTDKEAVLDVAMKEHIDGIVAYASDPAAPTAAYVAEKMGLPTNSYESVEILAEKHLFRKFLKEYGFNCPQSASFTSYSEVERLINSFNLPLMVKPSDSSGSKGITKVDDISKLKQAFEYAMKFSRKNVVIIEEYIERTNEFVIGGDIFVLDGKIIFWGLLDCHRDTNVNPLVPVGKSWPASITTQQMSIIKQTEQRLMDLLKIKFGAFNVEMIFGKDNRLYLIENGPRNGGNMIPNLLQMATGFDMVEATVKCAMGDFDISLVENRERKFLATHNIHVDNSGILEKIRFSDSLKNHIVRENIYVKSGDEIEYFDSANKALGIIFMQFEDKESMSTMLRNINKEIDVISK